MRHYDRKAVKTQWERQVKEEGKNTNRELECPRCYSYHPVVILQLVDNRYQRAMFCPKEDKVLKRDIIDEENLSENDVVMPDKDVFYKRWKEYAQNKQTKLAI